MADPRPLTDEAKAALEWLRLVAPTATAEISNRLDDLYKAASPPPPDLDRDWLRLRIGGLIYTAMMQLVDPPRIESARELLEQALMEVTAAPPVPSGEMTEPDRT